MFVKEEFPVSESQNIGRVVQVIGPVVDVEFPGGELPEIYNAVRIEAEEKDQCSCW